MTIGCIFLHLRITHIPAGFSLWIKPNNTLRLLVNLMKNFYLRVTIVVSAITKNYDTGFLINILQATIFEIKGAVASPYQFITTDSVKNFLRVALYLDVPIENDSIAPVINYLKDDVNQILNTLTWNE